MSQGKGPRKRPFFREMIKPRFQENGVLRRKGRKGTRISRFRRGLCRDLLVFSQPHRHDVPAAPPVVPCAEAVMGPPPLPVRPACR
ncbi:hypothetical protein ASZ90_002503 [hydrocarbon metagenome]|uniref:Uncharacterized protein n=1 Tax=hydrocarbon metagenome TaxID=938273 RepID=A0A0W8G3H6_9ZZZZ